MSTSDQPHGRRGWLKNGNPPGDLTKVPRCGANAKRTQKPCQAPAMANGRCQVHGGKSTGPRTPKGLAQSRRANWKTGYHSAEAKAERREFAQLFAEARTTLKQVKEII